MSAYVICAECGARIRSDREHCLRCGEPLRGLEPPAPPLPLHEALGVSEQTFQALSIVASLIVVAGLVWLWQARPQPAIDEIAVPLNPTAVPRTVSPPPPPSDADPFTAASPRPPSAPVGTSLDARRDGGGAFAAGDFASARDFYQTAVDRNPNDAEAHNNLGQALERLGRVADAVTHFERAVALVPDKWAYRFNLAHGVGAAGQWDRAITEYREAVRLFPADYATQYNLALALYKRGDPSAAVPEFEKAIALAPSEPSFHFSLGMTFEKLGRVSEAVREYRRFLEMDPLSPDAAKLNTHIEALTAAQIQGRGSSLAPRP
jgi:tetratricopeptide (TPR) repeat protein